jgi:hypothetical protein
MRVWGLRRVDRNTWVLGNNAVIFDIVTESRESHQVVIDDRFFKGRYDYRSKKHKRWIDAQSDLMRRAKKVSSDVKRMLGK